MAAASSYGAAAAAATPAPPPAAADADASKIHMSVGIPVTVVVYMAGTPAQYVELAGLETYGDVRNRLAQKHNVDMVGKAIVDEQDNGENNTHTDWKGASHAATPQCIALWILSDALCLVCGRQSNLTRRS